MFSVFVLVERVTTWFFSVKFEHGKNCVTRVRYHRSECLIIIFGVWSWIFEIYTMHALRWERREKRIWAGVPFCKVSCISRCLCVCRSCSVPRDRSRETRKKKEQGCWWRPRLTDSGDRAGRTATTLYGSKCWYFCSAFVSRLDSFFFHAVLIYARVRLWPSWDACE